MVSLSPSKAAAVSDRAIFHVSKDKTHPASLHSYAGRYTRTPARQGYHSLPFGSHHRRRCRFSIPLPPLEDPQFLSQSIPMRQQEERIWRGGFGCLSRRTI